MVTCNPDEAKSSKYVNNNCRAHLFIQDQELATNYGTAVRLTFNVLAATDPLQVGKEFSEFFNCSGGGINTFLNVAEAAGLITREQRAAAVQNKTPLDIDETLFKGRQICASIVMQRKQIQDATGKRIDDPTSTTMFPHINFDSYSVFSEKAKDIPKDQQMLAMLSGSASAGTVAAPVSPTAAPQSASVGDLF